MSADPTADPRQDYDARRTRCPVHAHAGHVTAYGHPEVLEVVTRPEVYSTCSCPTAWTAPSTPPCAP